MNTEALELQPFMEVASTTWKVVNYRLALESEKAPEFMDITEQVVKCAARSGVQNGIAVVYSKHTTAAIRLNENEPLLHSDLEEYLGRLAPRDGDYRHNDFNIRTVNMNEDECPNGHAHCQHLLLGTSETIPVIDGELQLGQWQRVFVIELDRPRQREVMVQLMGVTA